MPTEIQAKIIEEMGIAQEFDVEAEIRKRVDFLKDYLKSTGMRSLVLGISGGIDSTTAGKLAQKAVNELRQEGVSAEFIAVRLPYGVQKDEEDANLALLSILPDDIFHVNIGSAADAIMNEVTDNLFTKVAPEVIDFNKGNVKARQRMIAQYAIAGMHNGLVIGTDHGAEAVMGFFTKFGDGAADILPLAGLNKRRVRAIAEKLGIPPRLVKKTPTADLEDNRPQLPDEVAHGVTYDQIDDFLEGKDIDKKAHDIIVAAYKKTAHKRALPVGP